jgi:hypothetical protein
MSDYADDIRTLQSRLPLETVRSPSATGEALHEQEVQGRTASTEMCFRDSLRSRLPPFLTKPLDVFGYGAIIRHM